jgi:spermidine synthase
MGIMGRFFDEQEEFGANAASPIPFVHEEDGTLSLHFEDNAVQSRMHINAPEDFLALSYTRAIMGFLLFNTHPRHIGMIGLGGGSIPKYCYRYLPNSKISIAEISPEVIALRDRFYIPEDNFRFKVYCEDGADFIARYSNEFDVLIVDGFEIGQPWQLCSHRFYDDCYKALAPDGMMVVNLCEHVQILLSRIRRTFQDRVLVVTSEDRDNQIAFAGKGNILDRSEDEFRRALEHMKHHHPVKLNRTASSLEQERRRYLQS